MEVMEKPGILSVSRTEKKEIDPIGVVFHVRVEGEKLLLGNAALQQSQVVRGLVNGLKELGAKDEDFEVKNVTSKASGGVFGTNTKAVYQLAIKLEDMAQIGKYFGLISSQGATLGCDMEWKFDEAAVADELSTKALVAAKKAAEQMTEAIGYKVVGIKRCTDGLEQNHFAYAPQVMAGDFLAQPARRAPDADIGTEFRATRTVSRGVSVDFRISPV
jgi:uncharacterized protein YggE